MNIIEELLRFAESILSSLEASQRPLHQLQIDLVMLLVFMAAMPETSGSKLIPRLKSLIKRTMNHCNSDILTRAVFFIYSLNFIKSGLLEKESIKKEDTNLIVKLLKNDIAGSIHFIRPKEAIDQLSERLAELNPNIENNKKNPKILRLKSTARELQAQYIELMRSGMDEEANKEVYTLFKHLI